MGMARHLYLKMPSYLNEMSDVSQTASCALDNRKKIRAEMAQVEWRTRSQAQKHGFFNASLLIKVKEEI